LRLLSHSIIMFALFFYLPKFGPLERSIIEASGWTARTHPITFAVLYDHHNLICIAMVCLFFICAMLVWSTRNLRFQLRKAVGVAAVIFYIVLVCSVNSYSYIKGGRWWLYFGVLSVALNDSSAYFAGRLFGKHHLIGLSPNKTIEGFIGGSIGNVICCYVVASYKLNGDFW